jgi:hypothetical protein
MSRLSYVKWRSVEAEPRSSGTIAAVLEHPIARLTRQTGIPDVHGTTLNKTVELLRVAAEIEHAFIVQYLYGALSLRQDDPNGNNWYTTLLAIAVEEMGHLMTVQNLLSILCQPPYLERQSYPAPASYPFEKTLKCFALGWLGDFVIAESPVDATLPRELPPNPNARRVATYYTYLYWLFKESEQPSGPWAIPNPHLPDEHLKDSDFADVAMLMDHIMTPEDWGVAPQQTTQPTAGIQVLAHGPFTTTADARDGALNAIYDVAAQGEGPIPQSNSHFDRLSQIYTTASTLSQIPLKNVSDNPHTSPEGRMAPENETGLITHPTARQLAALLNLRYGMLLTEIGLAARMPRSAVAAGVSIKCKLAAWAMDTDMYAIHQLSDLLNAQPLKASRTAPSDLRASPPFELPAQLPSTEQEGWQFCLDVLDRTKAIVHQIGTSIGGLDSIFEGDDDRRAFIASRQR